MALAALVAAPQAAAQSPPATGSHFGGAGLLETRNARFRPDGTLEAGAAIRHQRRFWFANFQALPFLETTFRLTERLNATTGAGITTDRAFDLKLRVWEEDAWRPALAIGLQDLIGTGIYGGEYLVASKRFGPLDFSLGLGWGRLGTGTHLRNPLAQLDPRFKDREREVGEGGRPAFDSWFRGRDAAVFAGVEWTAPPVPTPLGVVEGLGVKLEYSGDALRDERGGFPRTDNRDPASLRGAARSRVNVGVHWQPNPFLDLGLAFVHGTDLLARASFRIDPARPPDPPRPDPAPPLLPRPPAGRAFDPGALAAALAAAGFRVVAADATGTQARLVLEGGRFPSLAQTVGRAIRAAQPQLPAGVETIALEWRRAGVAIARITLLRAAFEAAAIGQGSAEEILAASRLDPAETDPTIDPLGRIGFGWSLEPRLALVPGDPAGGVLYEAGAVARGRVGLGAGVGITGSVAQRIAGNLDTGRPSDSQLPRVRSDYARYAAGGSTTIPLLTLERIWTPAPDWFARVTAGLLEPMFAGVAGEVLWRPSGRPIAIGFELAEAVQRDYGGGFGALGYTVTTGHASIYADLPLWNITTVLRAGRYLAGDWGATIELARRFESGIEVGGFATFTDVPFSKFGEGSFDKGIFVRFPLALLGARSGATGGVTIRPVQRDGGQRLAIDQPLFELTRAGRAAALAEGFRSTLR